MPELNVALVIVGALALTLGLLAPVIRRSFVSEPLIAVFCGLALDLIATPFARPGGLQLSAIFLEEAARITLGIAAMAAILRVPPHFFKSGWQPITIILSLVMLLMWVVSGLLAYLIIGVPFWTGMLIGAIVTPTDPVLASSIITGGFAERLVPSDVRWTLSSESGANDGLAYPLVFLPILMLTRPPDQAVTHWVQRTLAWEVGLAIIVGAVAGYVAAKLLDWAEVRERIGSASILAYTLALTLLVLGAVKLMGSDGLLAVFVAGAVLISVSTEDLRLQEERVQEAMNRFFFLPVLLLFGIMMPWQEWISLGWAGVVLAVAVLLLRRLPAMLAATPLMGPLKSVQTMLFLGWFGPIGVGAVYYATLSERMIQDRTIWVVVSLIVFVSIVAHGVTSAPFTRIYARALEKPSRRRR